MTKKYHYNNKELTVKELVALSGINYDTLLNRLRHGWTVDDAIKTPLHSRPSKATKIDLLESIPRADCFNGIDLTRQDKAVITGLIADYLSSKAKGLELLDKKRP